MAMNFHFNGNQNRQKLLKELVQIDQDLQVSRHKLADKRKLEDQFYEDQTKNSHRYQQPQQRPFQNMKNNFHKEPINNNIDLADQIMRELMNDGPSKPPTINNNRHKNQNNSIRREQNQKKRVPEYSNPPIQNKSREYEPVQIKARNVPKNFQQPSIIPNKRQLQKQKLQNWNGADEYPFGKNSVEKQRRQITHSLSPPPNNISHHRAQRDNPSNSYEAKVENKSPNINKQYGKNGYENPFIKNDQLIKQKREQEQKKYRKLLQEQMEQQKRRKNLEKQKYKQQYNDNFNNYVPNPNNHQQIKQNFVTLEDPQLPKKKRDPNGQFPKYTLQKNQSEGDLNFMKLQIQQLRAKLKKGRIHYDQYQRDIKKIQKHYGRKLEEVFGQDIKSNKSAGDNPPSNINKKQFINHENEFNKIEQQQKSVIIDTPSPSQYNGRTKSPQFSHQPNYQQHNNYMERNIHQQISQNSYVPINTNGSNPTTQNGSEVQFQMMLKLFEGLKQLIQLQQKSQENMLNEKKFLEDTYSKFNPYLLMSTMQMNQMNMNPMQIGQLQQQQMNMLNYMNNIQGGVQNSNLMTQNVPANVYDTANKKERQFHTEKRQDNKQNYNNIISNSNSQTPLSESHISESYMNSHIDKSLSGIVSKIPLTSKQKQREAQNQHSHQHLQKFYSKKYRVKSCKEFQYFQVATDKSVKNKKKKQIPSVSNYLQDYEGEKQLEKLFEADLHKYKQYQKTKELEMIKSRLESNSSLQKKSSHSKKSTNQNKNNQRFPGDMTKNKIQNNNQDKQKDLANPFLKKHVSSTSNYEQIPTFHQEQLHDYKIQSPLVNSNDAKSSQILEQEQYQTEPRRGSPNDRQPEKVKYPQPMYQKKSQRTKEESQRREHPTQKILKVMKTNDQLLNKYMQTPSPSRRQELKSSSSIQESIQHHNTQDGRYNEESKEYESKQYFESKDISPVQHRNYNYESSLQTVRSEEESARRSNTDIIMGGLPSMSALKGSYSQSIKLKQQGYSQSNREQQEDQNQQDQRQFAPNYCATVQSVEESASKLPVFNSMLPNKPPMHRKYNINNNSMQNKSSSRKKESVVKINNHNHQNESTYKSEISGSYTSQQKQSQLIKVPSYEPYFNNSSAYSSKQQSEDMKLDSNVYESVYEQSVNLHKNHQKINRFSNKTSGKHDQNNKLQQKSSIQNNSQNNTNSHQLNDQAKSNTIASIPKWKSLEQARKIARQFRQKSGNDSSRKSVEEKLSEFESFIHLSQKKEPNDHDSLISVQSKNKIEPLEPSATNSKINKKNILEILDGLEEEKQKQQSDYNMDFQSYREESER